MKKNIVISLAILVIITLIISIILLLSKEPSKELEDLAIKFYENYYEVLDDNNREVILSAFKEKGINVTLDKLLEFDDSNKDKFKNCNKTSTYVLIYPKKPYGNRDYKITLNLSC